MGFNKLYLLGNPTKLLRNIQLCNRLTGDGLASHARSSNNITFSYEEDHTMDKISQVNVSRQPCLIFPTLEQVAFIYFFGVKQL